MAIKISRLACAFWFEWGIFCLLICCLCRRSIKLSIFYNHFPPFYLVFCVFLINMIAHMEKATCQYIFNMFSRGDSVTILRALCLYRAKKETAWLELIKGLTRFDFFCTTNTFILLFWKFVSSGSRYFKINHISIVCSLMLYLSKVNSSDQGNVVIVNPRLAFAIDWVVLFGSVVSACNRSVGFVHCKSLSINLSELTWIVLIFKAKTNIWTLFFCCLDAFFSWRQSCLVKKDKWLWED